MLWFEFEYLNNTPKCCNCGSSKDVTSVGGRYICLSCLRRESAQQEKKKKPQKK